MAAACGPGGPDTVVIEGRGAPPKREGPRTPRPIGSTPSPSSIPSPALPHIVLRPSAGQPHELDQLPRRAVEILLESDGGDLLRPRVVESPQVATKSVPARRACATLNIAGFIDRCSHEPNPARREEARL